MTRTMQVVEYNNNWPQMFEVEPNALQNALGTNCLKVHHIGSTSVPNLVAKPIIDIIIVVVDIAKVDQHKLTELGYSVRGEMGMPFRIFCNKGDPTTHHLHIWEENNPEIKKHLLFRDFLKSHPDYLKRYADLKVELYKKYLTDRKNYTESKDQLIKEIIDKSGFDEFTVVQVNLPNEIEAYKKIMQDSPSNSDEDLYFVIMQGSRITGAAHVKLGECAEIVGIKCDTQDQTEYLQSMLGRWIARL